MDWNKLKAEYIAGGTSYRKLAEKYKVDRNAIQRVATREKWCDLKSQAKAKGEAKMVNAVSQKIADRSIKINDVADKLLDKIMAALEFDVLIDSQSIKHFTSALKDIKDIKGIKSEIDIKEQEARIEKLRKDIEGDKPADDKPCGVVMMPPINADLELPEEEEDDNGLCEKN